MADKKIELGVSAAPLVDTLLDVAARNAARDKQQDDKRPTVRAPAVSSG